MTSQELAYSEIERLVQRFKDVPAAKRNQNEHQSMGHEDDLDRVRNLEREIIRVDEEIDKRVYVLYGLSPEEIMVVEGS